jgi:zinc protease
VLTGDLTPQQGFALAEKAYGGWKKPATPPPAPAKGPSSYAPRNVVIDLPGTGQAAVVAAKPSIVRADPRYYAGLVANGVLGGGYSARLNQEIRIKRGLSYGANSSLTPRAAVGGFSASVQTKNESAAQVVTLIKEELAKLGQAPASAGELAARKSVLIGGYGRELGTSEGLADILGGLAVYGVPLNEVQAYTGKVEAVTAAEVQDFSRTVLDPAQASVIVVGDAKSFGDTVKAVLPNAVQIPVDQLDLDSPTLRKAK